MAGALTAGDPARLERLAHTLKGTSATVGADRLSELCRGVEEAAAMHEVNEARRLVEECRGEYLAMSVELAEAAGLPAPH